LPPSKVPFKEYTNLPKGDYQFQVRGFDATGKPWEQGQYAFTILPNWYQTLPARLVIGALILALLYLVREWLQSTLGDRPRQSGHFFPQLQSKTTPTMEA